MVYWSIVFKLLIGMAGILLFLRMTGKTQMANLTSMETVNTIVLGALVGSIIYMPDTWVWVLGFVILVWFLLNLLVRLLLKIHYFDSLIHGKPEFLIKDGKINLRILKSFGYCSVPGQSCGKEMNIPLKEVFISLICKGIS